MIKKVIFDLDDTLIINRIDIMNNYDYILKKYNMNTTVQELYDVIGSYELVTNKYDKLELLNLINNYYGTNYPINIVDDIIDVVGLWTYNASKEVVNTLKYLYDKYELYVLSNWFYKSQVLRLKRAGIIDFFKEIRTAEIVTKPNEEAFTQFFDDCTPEECVIIGDSLKIDIEVPNKLGMKTILCNFKDKKVEYDGRVITSFKELVDIL